MTTLIPTPQQLPFRRALPGVAFLAFMFFINYTNRAIVSPLLIYLEQDLHMDHVQATSLLLFQSSGFFLSVFFSGFLVAYAAPRRVVALSSLCSGVVMLGMSAIGSILSASMLFILLGAATGLYFTAAMSTLASITLPKDWSSTVAVHELAPTISFILSPLIAQYTVDLAGWRGCLFTMGIISLVSGMAFFFWGRGGTQKADRPSSAGAGQAVRRPLFWVFVWIFALGVAAEFAPYSVLPLSLTSEQGFTPEEATTLLSFTRLLSPLAVIFGGWATPNLGVKKTLALFLLVQGAALAAMGLPVADIGTKASGIAMAMQAMAPAFLFPALFTAIARSFPAGQQPMLLAMLVPLASIIGTGMIPFFLGVCGTYLTFSTGFVLLGITCILTLPMLRVLNTMKSA